MIQGYKTKAAIAVSKIIEKIQLIIGGFIVFVFSIYGLFSESKLTGEDIVIIIIMLALGIWLIYLSKKRHKLLHSYTAYVHILSVNPTGSIANLASSLGTSKDEVLKNLRVMIKRKLFVNAYIDLERDRIVFPSIGKQVENVTETKIEYIAVTCKSCGAVNKVQKGVVAECEYCGTQLMGE